MKFCPYCRRERPIDKMHQLKPRPKCLECKAKADSRANAADNRDRYWRNQINAMSRALY